MVSAGLARMEVICTVYFICGCMDTLASGLRGRGYSVMPMVVSLVGSCLLRVVWVDAQGWQDVRRLYPSRSQEVSLLS